MQKLPDPVRAIYTDIYHFHERHIDMGDTAEEWEACAADARDLCRKHEGNFLAHNLIIAVYYALERERGHYYGEGAPLL